MRARAHSRRSCTLALAGVLTALASACEPFPALCVERLTDACVKARDLAYAVGVQVGDATATGNAVLGETSALHKQGLVSVAARVNTVTREIPRFDGVTIRTDGTPNRTSFASESDVVASVAVDGAVGALRGFKAGDTRVGGIDLLGGVAILPGADGGGLSIGAETPFALSLGVRAGVLQETRRLPAVSITAMVRNLPRFSVGTPSLPADSGGSVRISLRNLEVTTLSYRLATSKRIGRFAISAGAGRDDYDGSADYEVVGTGDALASGEDYTTFRVRRTTAFGGMSYMMDRATVAAEVGRLFGGHVPEMANSFGDRSPTAPRTFVTLGVRFRTGRTVDRD